MIKPSISFIVIILFSISTPDDRYVIVHDTYVRPFLYKTYLSLIGKTYKRVINTRVTNTITIVSVLSSVSSYTATEYYC